MLFVCLEFFVLLENFGDVTIAGEGLQILTYARHSWPLSSEGSLACHTYWDTWSLYNGHLRGPVTLTPNTKRLAVELSLPVLTTQGCHGWDSNPWTCGSFHIMNKFLSTWLTDLSYPKLAHGTSLICLFCLLVWGFSSHSIICHSYGDVIIAGEGLQILTYARHSWPLRSEGSLACHTYCDTGHPFIMFIFEDPCHSQLLPSVRQWSCHYLF